MNKQVKKFVKLIFFIFVFYSLNIVTSSAAEDPLSKLLNKGFKIITEQKLTESKIQPLFEEKNLFITYNSKIYEFSFDSVGFFEVFDDIQKINSGTWKISGLFQNAILLNFEKNFEEKKELYFQLYPDLKKISTLTTLVNPNNDEQTDRPVKYADKQVAKKERVSKIEKIEEEKRLALQKKITAEKEAKRIAAKKVKDEEEARLKAKAEEEAKRIAAEKVKAEEEAKRIAAEKIKAEEEVGRLANEKQKLEKELQKYKLEENKKIAIEEEKKYGRKCTKGTFFSKRDLFEIGSEEYKTCIKNKGPEKQLEEKKRSQSEKSKPEEESKLIATKKLKADEETERNTAEKLKANEDANKIKNIKSRLFFDFCPSAVYEGEVKNGKPDGFGVLKFDHNLFGIPDPSLIESCYKNFINYKKYEGNPDNHSFIEQANISLINISGRREFFIEFSGEFKNGFPNGKVKRKSRDRYCNGDEFNILTGDFVDGLYNGKGQTIYCNGTVRIEHDHFKNFKPHGLIESIYSKKHQKTYGKNEEIVKLRWKEGIIEKYLNDNPSSDDKKLDRIFFSMRNNIVKKTKTFDKYFYTCKFYHSDIKRNNLTGYINIPDNLLESTKLTFMMKHKVLKRTWFYDELKSEFNSLVHLDNLKKNPIKFDQFKKKCN